MKTLIRAVVVALAVTGAVASTQVSASAQSKTTVTRNSALPIPMCAPDDPNCCGIR